MFHWLHAPWFKKTVSALLCAASLAAFPMASHALQRYEIVSLGDRDSYVTELQDALYKAGYLKQKPTGYYGTDTQNAVIAFQKAKGLDIDGKAGPETRKAILGKSYEAISASRKTQGDSGALKYSLGDKGDEIKKFQQRLSALEYYTYEKITGYYGPMTKLAVERFQRANGLAVNGVLDEEAINLLKSSEAKTYTIYPGDKSDDVKKMQERLKELGYLKGECTGYFGTVTDTALRSFQKTNGLAADGKAGPSTRKLLFSGTAKKFTGATAEGSSKTVKNAASKVQTMLEFARAQLGKKYVRGREGPSTFDCSGFVYYVITKMGVHTTRYTADGFSKVTAWTKITSISSLKPGDLLFWKNSPTSSRIGHTGIYIGGGKFINASASNHKVVYGTMKGYYVRNFAFARRIF